MPLASKRLAGRSRSCAMVFTPRCYWPRRTDDSYQDIVAAGANGLGPSALPQPTTTLSCSVLTAKFFPPTSLGLDRARPTGAFKSSVTRMHGKAARPGKTIGFLSRENYYFPRPQSLSIWRNSISPFTLRASLKAFGQSWRGRHRRIANRRIAVVIAVRVLSLTHRLCCSVWRCSVRIPPLLFFHTPSGAGPSLPL